MTNFVEERISKIDGKFVEIPRPLITDGEYPSTIKEWKVIPNIFGRPKLIILCDVPDGRSNYELAYFCNLELSKDKKIQFPGKRSNFYKLVRSLLPKSNGEYDLDDLIGITCRVIVGTSTVNDKKENKPIDERYSVIRKFIPLRKIKEEEYSDDETMPY